MHSSEPVEVVDASDALSEAPVDDDGVEPLAVEPVEPSAPTSFCSPARPHPTSANDSHAHESKRIIVASRSTLQR